MSAENTNEYVHIVDMPGSCRSVAFQSLGVCLPTLSGHRNGSRRKKQAATWLHRWWASGRL